MMAVVPLNDKSTSVDVLLSQIKESGCESFVAVVRVDGAWQTGWTSGLDLGSLSMAALKLQTDIIQEMHRDDDQDRLGWTRGETFETFRQV